MFIAFAGVAAEAQTVANEDDIRKCEDALATGDKDSISSAISRITEWRHVFDTKLRSRAEKCLSAGYQEEWVYDWPLGIFAAKSDVDERSKVASERALDRRSKDDRQRAEREKAAMQVIADAQQRKEANEARILTESFQACARLYARDRDAAMLNSICIQRFIQFGMP